MASVTSATMSTRISTRFVRPVVPRPRRIASKTRKTRPSRRGRLRPGGAGIDAPSVEEVLSEASTEISTEDKIISVLFTLAVFALLLITVGAIYLAISDAQDRKAEEADKLGRGNADVTKKKKRIDTGTGGGKGFGRS